MCTCNRLMKFPLEEEIIISRNQPVTIIPSVLLIHLSFASYTNHPLKYTGLSESSNCVAVVCLSLTQGVGSFSDLGSFPPSFSPPFLLFSLPFSCSPSHSPSHPPPSPSCPPSLTVLPQHSDSEEPEGRNCRECC